MTLDPWLLEVLACPSDKGPLLYLADEDILYNPRIRLRYRVEDGIPVMLVEEAETLDDDEHRRLMAKVGPSVGETPGTNTDKTPGTNTGETPGTNTDKTPGTNTADA